MIKHCKKCRKNYDLSHFIERDATRFTQTCIKCRFHNAARFVSNEQNHKEYIFDKLKKEGIKRIHVYSLYLSQKKRCYLCNRRVNVPLMYINKFNEDRMFCCNMFLSCVYCYKIRDSDDSIAEFIYKLQESNYPFNKSNITIQKMSRNRTFLERLIGIVKVDP